MVDVGTGLIGLAAAVAIAGTAIGAGLAEQQIGAAAVGAIVEKEEFFGKGLLFTVIHETLVIFGLAIAIIILGLAK